ncbi:hypothetical protein M758_4G182100 [Ceratodon purpureus]|nr:hypothetical protein M758_4G182100 [Ceratodon purpureus]
MAFAASLSFLIWVYPLTLTRVRVENVSTHKRRYKMQVHCKLLTQSTILNLALSKYYKLLT